MLRNEKQIQVEVRIREEIRLLRNFALRADWQRNRPGTRFSRALQNLMTTPASNSPGAIAMLGSLHGRGPGTPPPAAGGPPQQSSAQLTNQIANRR